MQREARLYLKLIKMHMLSAMEYKGWWLMCIWVIVVCVSDIASTFLLFDRFGAIGRWSAPHIVMIYSLAVSSFGLAESLCRGFDSFPWNMLRTGDFDRLLLRPMRLTVQVAGSVFHLHRLMRVITGLMLLMWAWQRLQIPFTFLNALILLMALTGGTILYMGVFIFSSGIAFYTIRALDWIFIFTNASYQVTRVPADYLAPVLKHIFTFFMPMLVISYYPTAVLCGYITEGYLAFLSVPAGLLFFGLSLIIWRVGVRHYTSTGS